MDSVLAKKIIMRSLLVILAVAVAVHANVDPVLTQPPLSSPSSALPPARLLSPSNSKAELDSLQKDCAGRSVKHCKPMKHHEVAYMTCVFEWMEMCIYFYRRFMDLVRPLSLSLSLSTYRDERCTS